MRKGLGRNRPWFTDVFCCFDNERIKPIIGLFNYREKLLAHAWFPEMVDVVGNTRHRFVLWLRVEERRYLVGHVDQLVCG